MNNCNFLGRLTRDVELRHTASGKTVASFGLAVGNGEFVDFFDCVAWGQQAENLAKHFQKGELIALECSARLEKWEKDGEKRSKVVFYVNRFHFIGANKPRVKDEEQPNKVVVDDKPKEVDTQDEIPF